MRQAPPTLVFATLGQARADRRISPRRESKLLSELLTYWALRHALDASADCTARAQAQGTALVT